MSVFLSFFAWMLTERDIFMLNWWSSIFIITIYSFTSVSFFFLVNNKLIQRRGHQLILTIFTLPRLEWQNNILKIIECFLFSYSLGDEYSVLNFIFETTAQTCCFRRTSFLAWRRINGNRERRGGERVKENVHVGIVVVIKSVQIGEMTNNNNKPTMAWENSRLPLKYIGRSNSSLFVNVQLLYRYRHIRTIIALQVNIIHRNVIFIWR